MSFTSKIGSLASRAYGWSAAVARAVDQYFEYVTLLLPGNGTNGAQNNTFLDGSTNNFTITRNGNTTQGTFSPFSQTGWGNLFVSASSQYLSLSSSSFAVGTGAFTIEGWVYLNSYTYGSVFASWNAANTGVGMMLGFDNTGKIQFSIGNASGSADTTIVTASSISLNTWVFLQATKAAGSGGAMTIYINGTSSATTTTTRSIDRSAAVIGRYYQDAAGNQINGYLSNVRVSNTVRSSTVPTAPFTNDANTLLLTCQSNRFLDVSLTPITITPNGSPTVVAFSPFNPTASWSAATYGGSGYFDGSSDFLSFANNTALQLSNSTAYTIEALVYLNSLTADGGTAGPLILDCYNQSSPFQGYALGVGVGTVGSGNFEFWDGTAWNVIGAASVSQWLHVAISYEGSGTTRRFFINGKLQGSASTQPSTINYTSAATFRVGGRSGSNGVNGYISNLRIVKGTAVYTADFTPPTTPLTAITNTSLLLNFTNAGIYDATSKNDLETLGDAQISTTINNPFGAATGTIKFDGTTDTLKIPASQVNTLGIGDFTIEGWIYISSNVANSMIISNGVWAANKWAIQTNAASQVNKLSFWVNNISASAVLASTTTLTTGTWYYMALTRSGTTLKLFLNGTQEASTISSGSIDGDISSIIYVGSDSSTVSTFFNGYISNLRITKGYARTITASPTAAFPTL